MHTTTHDGSRDVEITAGKALVVPRGVWHLVAMKEPGRLLHITPGGAHRRLQHS